MSSIRATGAVTDSHYSNQNDIEDGNDNNTNYSQTKYEPCFQEDTFLTFKNNPHQSLINVNNSIPKIYLGKISAKKALGQMHNQFYYHSRL